MSTALSGTEIGQRIYFVRNNRIMLDADLAHFYEIETFNLNKAANRNRDLFPCDFMYQLTREEWTSLKFQYGISKFSGRGGRRTLPYCFTQEGVAMLSSILHNKQASEASIAILRTFAKLRNNSDESSNLAMRIDQLESSFNKQIAIMSSSLQQIVAALCFSPPGEATAKSPADLKFLSSPITGTKAMITVPIDAIVYKRQIDMNVELIRSIVAKYFHISAASLISASRTSSTALPRQVGMYFIRKYLGLSFKEIGRIFGGRDHTTILYACRKIDMECKSNIEVRETLNSIQRLIDINGLRITGNR
jgi:hypothetical protein